MNATTTRQQLRLLAMSTEDLRNLADADDRYAYTDAEQIRFERIRQMCATEIARRVEAGGR